MKKVLALFLALSLIFNLSAVVYADTTDIETAGTSKNSTMTLSTVAPTFSVTIPTVIPLSISADGTVTTATNVKIINNNTAPVIVTALTISPVGDWEIKSYDTDFSKVKVDSTYFALNIMGEDVPTTGVCDLTNFTSIEGNGELEIDYEGKVSIQSIDLSDVSMATAAFTVTWDAEE